MTIEEFCTATNLTLNQVNGSDLIDNSITLEATSMPEGVTMRVNGDFRAPNLLTLPMGTNIIAVGNIALNSCDTIHETVKLVSGNTIFITTMTDCSNIFTANKSVILRKLVSASSNTLQVVSRKCTSITTEYIKFDKKIFKVIERTNDTYTLEGLDGDTMCLHTDQLGNWSLATTESESLENMAYLVADRRKSDYLGLTPLSLMSREEIVKCYITITSACVDGTKEFDNLVLKPLNQGQISIQQLADLTAGYYGHDKFKDFFNIE